MCPHLRPEACTEVEDVGTEMVAGMLHIRAHTQLLLRAGILEPIFALDVVGLALAGGIARELQRGEGLRREMAR